MKMIIHRGCGHAHDYKRVKPPGYLGASEPGWGSPGLGRWLFGLQTFSALGPERLSPPNDRVSYPASSPVSVLPECGQTPLSDPLSRVPVEPTTQIEPSNA